MYDLQKANVWKRISAAFLDVILLFIATLGFALLLTSVLGFDGYMAQKDALDAQYMEEYGLDPTLTQEELDAFTDMEKESYQAAVDAANEAIRNDPELSRLLGMILSLAMVIVIFSILLSYLIFEFLVPLLLKNGQTLGKKIFGVAVMRVDGVRLTPFLLFARTVLGKYTIGTMVPVFAVVLMLFGKMSFLGVLIVGGLTLLQAILFFGSRNHTPIHDKLAQTVAVDMASQMIFDSPEALLEYKKRLHAEQAETRER
jgi:uncharacterized RDD family membrane protein YckC